MSDVEKQWLTTKEICKELGVSSSTLYRLIAKHNLPAQKVGRFWNFKKVDVEVWIKSNRDVSSKKIFG